MVEIVNSKALTVGGFQQFMGVKIGDFTIRPDSDTGTRPDTLRVEWSGKDLLIRGGKDFRVMLASEGIGYAGFENWLSNEDRTILQMLAFDLTGRLWPNAGEVLKKKIEELGEDRVIKALHNLSLGVDTTLRRMKFWNSVPFVGRKLADIFCQIQN